MKKKLLSIAICFVMVAGLLAGVTMPIYAEEEYDGENVKLNDNDSFNLDDFELNTSNVTYMYSMFAYCTKLESVTGLETGNVTNMNSMFEHFEGMFQSCKKIKIIDLSNFRMDSDPMIYSMFCNCDSLENLDLSTWDVDNIHCLNYMFCNCRNLKTLDISTWDLRTVYIAQDTFDGCESLQTIDIPLNLTEDIGLPATFARADDPSVKYTALPKEQKVSFTIVRSGGAGGNVIDVDYEAGTAVVRDAVTEGERTVPLSTIEDGNVYRMYDATRGEHFYTEDANEVRGLASAGWTYEGISHYVYDKNSGKGIPQYRVYNPNSSNGEHNWTTDVAEYEGLINAGWKDEGAHWNVQDNGSRGTGIVGSFRYIDAEMPELVCTYTFKSNGIGTYDVSGEVQNLTYKVNGDILSITFEGQEIPMEVEFTVNAEALTMKDVTGADIVYYRV